MDYEALKSVLQCEYKRECQAVLNTYDETYLRELIQSKLELSQSLLAQEKSYYDSRYLL